MTFQILMLNASVGQPKKIIRSQSHAAVRGPHAGQWLNLTPKMLGENSRGPSHAATAVIACLDGENIGVSLLSAVNHWLSSGQPGAALRTESSPRRFRKTPPENKRRNPTRDGTAGAVHSWKTRLLVCKKNRPSLQTRHGVHVCTVQMGKCKTECWRCAKATGLPVLWPWWLAPWLEDNGGT